MKDQEKTREQLISELEDLRRKVAESEASTMSNGQFKEKLKEAEYL